MVKRSRRSQGGALGAVVRFLLKCIFVYPFQAIWFVCKQIHYVIRDLASGKKREEKVATKKGKESKAKALSPDSPVIIRAGTLHQDAVSDPLKEVHSLEGEFTKFEQKLYTQKSTIGLVLGARGTGKSALGMRVLENVYAQTGRDVYVMGFKAEDLPDWITTVSSLEAVPNGSFLLIDEGGVTFSSRKSLSDKNTLLSELLFIARHKDVSALFITQNSATIEVNVLRQADYLFLKHSSLLQKEFERKKIQEMYQDADTYFKKYKSQVGLTYVYADVYRGFIANTLPSFWSEGVSKAFAKKR